MLERYWFIKKFAVYQPILRSFLLVLLGAEVFRRSTSTSTQSTLVAQMPDRWIHDEFFAAS